MNYLKLMNAFLDRSSCEELSTEAQVLYIRLFGLFNKAVWKKTLRPNAQMLQGLTGLNDSAFARARQELAEEGYIKFDCTATKSGCTYELIKLYFDDEAKQEDEKEQNNDKMLTQQRQEEVIITDVFTQKNEDVKEICKRNEKEMKKKCERKPIYNNYNNNIYIKQNETREKQKEPQAAGLSQSLDFAFVKKIELFKKSYPDKVESNYLSYLKYKNILPDVSALIKQVDNSIFLKNNKNLNLSWLLENHLKVINGCYADFDNQQNNIIPSVNFNNQRKYTKEELDHLVDDITKVNF